MVSPTLNIERVAATHAVYRATVHCQVSRALVSTGRLGTARLPSPSQLTASTGRVGGRLHPIGCGAATNIGKLAASGSPGLASVLVYPSTPEP